MNILKDKYINNLIITHITLFLIETLFKVLNNFKVFSYSLLRIYISTFIISLIITFI